MKRIEIEVIGRTPLLMHRFTDAAAESATNEPALPAIATGDRDAW